MNATQCPGVFTPFSTRLVLSRNLGGDDELNDTITEWNEKPLEVNDLFGALQAWRFIGGNHGTDSDCHCLQDSNISNEEGEIMTKKGDQCYGVFDLNDRYEVALAKWKKLPMWYGLIKVVCKNKETAHQFNHFVSFFSINNDGINGNSTYYITGGEPGQKVIVTSDLLLLLHCEDGQRAILERLSNPFRADGYEVFFDQYRSNKFKEVVLFQRYYKLKPPSYAHLDRKEIKWDVIPFFFSANGSMPKKHHKFVCELVNVNDDRKMIEIGYEFE